MRENEVETDEARDWKIDQSKAWLRHVSGLEDAISQTDTMLEVISRLAEPRGIDYSRPVVSKSINPDHIADVIAVQEELSGRWRDERIRLCQELSEAGEVIKRIGNQEYADILTWHYIGHRSWAKIAYAKKYDEDHLSYYIQRKACRMLYDHPAKDMLYDYLPPEWKLPKAYK